MAIEAIAELNLRSGFKGDQSFFLIGKICRANMDYKKPICSKALPAILRKVPPICLRGRRTIIFFDRRNSSGKCCVAKIIKDQWFILVVRLFLLGLSWGGQRQGAAEE
jgi:hypothetical protein